MKEKTPSYKLELTYSSIVRVIVVLAVIYFLYLIRDIVAIIFFSVLLILLLQPPVDWLNKYKIPKPLGVLVIYLLLFAMFSMAIVLAIPPISSQLSQIITNLGTYIQDLSHYFGLRVENDLLSWPATFESLRSYLPGATENIFSRLTGVVSAIFTLFIVLVITFYGLVEKSAFQQITRTIIPSQYVPYLYRIANRIQKKLGQWLRGQMLLGLAIFLMTWLGLALLQVEYALTLAIITGILEFIPYVGPAISGILAVFLTISVSPWKAIMVAVLYVVIQQLENHILVPKIMQRTTGLNPIVSIISLLIGGKLGGVVGLLLAIPVATALSVFIQDFVDQQEEGNKQLA